MLLDDHIQHLPVSFTTHSTTAGMKSSTQMCINKYMHIPPLLAASIQPQLVLSLMYDTQLLLHATLSTCSLSMGALGQSIHMDANTNFLQYTPMQCNECSLCGHEVFESTKYSVRLANHLFSHTAVDKQRCNALSARIYDA